MRRAVAIILVAMLCTAMLFLCSACQPVCEHIVKPIVSAELVSQKKPLEVFQLMEEPEIWGIKVKLTYEDGSSEVVNAQKLKYHAYTRYGDYAHWKGMFFDTSILPLLTPGINQVALYCVDTVIYNEEVTLWELSPNPEETGLAFCMVEVMYMSGGA